METSGESKAKRKKKVTKVTIDRILSIRVSDQRFEQMRSGRHFEFWKVRIPPAKQYKLKIGDIIHANSKSGKTRSMEFLSLEQQPGYEEDQVDVLVRVI